MRVRVRDLIGTLQLFSNQEQQLHVPIHWITPIHLLSHEEQVTDAATLIHLYQRDLAQLIELKRLKDN